MEKSYQWTQVWWKYVSERYDVPEQKMNAAKKAEQEIKI